MLSAEAIHEHLTGQNPTKNIENLSKALNACKHAYTLQCGESMALREPVKTVYLLSLSTSYDLKEGERFFVSIYDCSNLAFSSEDDLLNKLLYEIPIEMGIGETENSANLHALDVCKNKNWQVLEIRNVTTK